MVGGAVAAEAAAGAERAGPEPAEPPDAGPDAVPDVVPDVGPDVGPDAVPDVVPDVGLPALPAPPDVEPGSGAWAGRRATVKDVAEAAGVSRSTASRALTGSGYVGQGVRERVQHAAERLGYVPDAMAQHLKQRVSRSIGLLVPDASSEPAAALVAGVTREASRRGYATVLVGDAVGGVDEVEAAERLVALRVAGVVVVPVSGGATTRLARLRTPVVEVDRRSAHGVADAVVTDETALVREVATHLLGLGHRRLVLLGDAPDGATARERRTGFLDAIRAAGLPEEIGVVHPTPDDVAAARAAALSLLSTPDRPTAVCATGERVAAGVWQAAAVLGLRLPDDLSLVSLDDAAWMRRVTPGVSAVDRDPARVGAAAVSRLLARADAPDGAPGTTVLPATVVHRGSTGSPGAFVVTRPDVSH
jgi:LacI family transcriptional regulator